jgi:glycosyltransferase involved in cell wall biosynthesis
MIFSKVTLKHILPVNGSKIKTHRDTDDIKLYGKDHKKVIFLIKNIKIFNKNRYKIILGGNLSKGKLKIKCRETNSNDEIILLQGNKINDENHDDNIMIFYLDTSHAKLINLYFIIETGVITLNFMKISKFYRNDHNNQHKPEINKNIFLSYRGLNGHFKDIKPSVLYMVSSTMPIKTNGYTVRTHNILKNLTKKGINVVCVNRPIISRHKKIEHIIHDNIKYIIPYVNNVKKPEIDNIFTKEYTTAYWDIIKKICRDYEFDIVHACSNYVNPLVGYKLSRKNNIPLIYEVRGLWHLSKLSNNPKWKNSDAFKKYLALENAVMDVSDHIFVISPEVGEELNVDNKYNDKISIAPNCVDTRFLKPLKKDLVLFNKYNKEKFFLIGYVGSVVNYEGIEYLVKSIKYLKDLDKKCKLIIVGKGTTIACKKTYQLLIDLVSDLDVKDRVIFTGDIPYEDIRSYYSIIDLICLPRKGCQVCELVTPLKPFEAMSMGKPLLASNVNPLLRIIDHKSTGLIHEKDDVGDIVDKIIMIMDDKNLLNHLKKNSRKWVIENRKWDVCVDHIIFKYKKLLRNNI